MASLKTERTTHRRLPKRGSHDFDTITSILDEGLYCHLGFVADGQPFVIPTAYGRDGRVLYVHGSAAGRTPRALAAGTAVCLTVTLLDGLVFARSAFHHSMNYRSVMVLGVAEETEGDEKLHGLATVTDHVARGRWDDTRPPTPQELKATTVLRLPIEEASAKVRTGGPVDDEEDLALAHWAGVLPMRLMPGAPEPHEALAPGTKAPPYIASYARG